MWRGQQQLLQQSTNPVEVAQLGQQLDQLAALLQRVVPRYRDRRVAEADFEQALADAQVCRQQLLSVVPPTRRRDEVLGRGTTLGFGVEVLDGRLEVLGGLVGLRRARVRAGVDHTRGDRALVERDRVLDAAVLEALVPERDEVVHRNHLDHA